MLRSLFTATAVFCLAALPASAADPLVLQLKWLPQAQFAGYYVAHAKGFYRRAGLDVAIRPGGPDITPAVVLAQGGADVAVDWMASALAARDKGAPLVNIAQVFQHSGMLLTCRRDAGIRRAADLKGKAIGVWFGGNQFPFLAWMGKLGLRTAGADPDVTIVPQGTGVDLLTGGRTACISTMSYNEYWQVVDAGLKPPQLAVFRYEDEGVATLEDGLYTTEAKLADPATRVRLARFLRASAEGWRYVAAHPQEAVDIVLRETPGLDERHQHRMLREVLKLLGGSRHGLFYLEPAAYERTVDVLLSARVDPVIRQRPQGAWTHEVWSAAFGR